MTGVEAVAKDEADKDMVRRLAANLFRIDMKLDNKPKDDRKPAWVASKAEYVRRAHALYLSLERDGVTLTAKAG